MKLIIGCPLKDRAWILPSWFTALAEQGIEHEVLVLLSPSSDDTEQILLDHGAGIIYDDEEGRPLSEIDSHGWGSLPTYEYMARVRNRLKNEAFDKGADYFLSLDSDILLPAGGLASLLTFAETHQGVVSPAVNMATGTVAWNTMRWDGELGSPTRDRGELPGFEADVIMAAMLIDRSAKDCDWRHHSAGEDIGFCINARNLGVKLWWYPPVRCNHIMWKQFYS